MKESLSTRLLHGGEEALAVAEAREPVGLGPTLLEAEGGTRGRGNEGSVGRGVWEVECGGG